ncbi:hypothetical protein [Promicromonospora sukumoe]
MRRGLVAGATAIGMLVAAAVVPMTGAAAVEQPVAPALRCDGSAPSEPEAIELAAFCAEDVEVLGASGSEGTALYAEPDGGMRMEAAVEDPVIGRSALTGTLLSESGPPEFGWEGTRWVGYCDPAEYADGCAESGVQRAVWQFDGFDILAELEPEDITSAEFIVNGETAWLDDVGCTANSLEIYDVPLVTAATGWASTAEWTDDKRVGAMSTYWRACGKSPAYTGYFDFDATPLAVDAARDGRTSVAVGLRSADETCMTCGWNLLRQRAILRVKFNRAPLAPSSMDIGFLYSKVPCVGEPALRTTMPFVRVEVTDPDPTGYTNWVETVSYRIARADTPEVVLWEGASTTGYSRPSHQAEVASGILEDRGRYLLTTRGTDNHGLTGPGTTCVFTVDISAPEAPVVAHLLGSEAVYPTGVTRGGTGIPGAFLFTSASADVASFEYRINGGFTKSVAVTGPGNRAVLELRPTSTGSNDLYVRSVDRAGNLSGETTYEFNAAKAAFFVPTPPAITVSGPTSYTVGDVPTASVTLSEDAATPYGTVTVTSGSTVVGSADFDERTEKLELDAAALGTGAKTLTFTYRALPEAPAWSTQRTITISLPAFSALRSPSISGTAQVGRTLTALRGPWTPSPTKTTYQWRLDGKAVSGATSSTWKATSSAKGKKVSVAITGTKAGYTTETLVSPASALVKAGVFSAPTPKITGTPKVGAKLAVVRGTWTPQPTTVKYQWKVAGKSVKGATGSTFKVPTSARGKRVAVVVTGSSAGYTTKTVTKSMTTLIR